VTSTTPAAGTAGRSGWIISPAVDVAMFAGPLLVSAGIVAWAYGAGRLHDPLPPWLFALLVVGCDVAHVWSTLFRTYLDPVERQRRGGLLVAVPLACLVGGVVLYSLDGTGLLFWRVLAYLAAFHFVRQQVGWVAWTGRKAGETDPWDRRLDRWMVYNVTVFPLLWWHAHLPRAFHWFVEGDFAAGLTPGVAAAGHLVHGTVAGVWIARQDWRAATGRGINGAKWLVMVTTWATWYGGIVLLDSDIAFTATNCLAHGIPYMVVIHKWGVSRWRGADGVVASLFRPAGVLAFLGLLLALAFVEEGLWDRLVWHEHGALFPLPAMRPDAGVLAVLVPLLTVPQAAHYVLDAFLWRAGPENPDLAEHLGLHGSRSHSGQDLSTPKRC
jgi:hypothetical protein